MSATLPIAAVSRQSDSLDRLADRRSTAVDQGDLLVWVNRAMSTAGWSKESLATAMQKDPSYVGKVLNGEKPLSVAFIRELPDDIEALVATYHAESFGLIVVAPARGDDAVRNLISGLIGVLRGAQLPEKAGPPVKAMLDSVGKGRR